MGGMQSKGMPLGTDMCIFIVIYYPSLLTATLVELLESLPCERIYSNRLIEVLNLGSDYADEQLWVACRAKACLWQTTCAS